MSIRAPVSLPYCRKRSSPAFLLRPYSLLPKRPVREACWLLESITGQVLWCFLSVSSRVLAKPKLPCINSSWFCGRLTPARLNTKSAFLQYSSNCSGVESRSYSKTPSIRSSGKRLSLPSAIFFSAQHRFFPTKPLAPVTSIFIFSSSCDLLGFFLASSYPRLRFPCARPSYLPHRRSSG